MLMHLAVRRITSALVTALLIPVTLAQVVIHVDDSAKGANDGTSWADAFTDLQLAIAAAQPGDQVWVAAGTYKPDSGTLDQNKRFDVPSGVAILGGFAGTEVALAQRDVALNTTILSGDLLGDDGPDLQNYQDNTYLILRAQGTAAGTRLDGLVVEHGWGYSLPTKLQASGLLVRGGVIAVSNCFFLGNRQSIGVGALWADMAATLTVDSCTFQGNSTPVTSGAVQVAAATTARFTRCTFIGNSGPANAGALAAYDSDVTIDGCLFTGNSTLNYGGAIQIGDCTASVTNCTFTGNSAIGGGGAIDVFSGPVHVANCILWGDTAPQAQPGEVEISNSGVVFVDYCCVTPPVQLFGGTANLKTDPLFVDADGPDNIFGTLDDDCRLESGSPCIDSGSNAAVVADSLDDDCDGDISEPMPRDLRRVSRFEDDPDSMDIVGQPAPVVDRGAYEFSRWTNLGHGVGDEKSPCLVGSGSWNPGFPLGITITGAKPDAFGVLFVGASEIDAPFKGGVMVPYPQFLNGITTDTNGQLAAQGLLPANAPPGFVTFIQAWFVDATGPKGLSATNAVSGKTP